MTQNQTVLVTGGAGFIGSWVVEELLTRSRTSRIVVMDNLSNGKRAFVPCDTAVSLEVVDLRDSNIVSRVYDKYRPDVVIHLAALHYIPYCNEHPAETMQVNVVGTQHLLDACLHAPPRVLILASTAAVYPICERANHEDDPVGPTDVYGLSKFVNERQLAFFAEQTNTRCAVARFFNAIGPRETNPHLVPTIFAQLNAGASELNLGNLEPKRDYIYVADIARAVLDLAEMTTARFRVYNVGTGKEYSARQIVACLAEIVGRPLSVKSDPRLIRKSDRMHLAADISRIKQEMGWRPQLELAESLQRTWETCHSEYRLSLPTG